MSANVLPGKLNLGCGRDRRPGYYHVDQVAELEPDLVWNLDRHPYPLPDHHFESVLALDVVEHLEDVTAFLVDVHRVLRPGGIVEITTPHFSCANSYTDPTHRRHLGFFSFDYFTPQSKLNFYSPARFEIAERWIAFPPGPVSGLISRWANRHPDLYEKRFAWLWPAWFLKLQLRAIS
jgi:SAM-dependent methyltransferase